MAASKQTATAKALGKACTVAELRAILNNLPDAMLVAAGGVLLAPPTRKAQQLVAPSKAKAKTVTTDEEAWPDDAVPRSVLCLDGSEVSVELV